MKASLIVVVAVALSAPLAAQWLNQPTAGLPRTPDGKPNLSAPAPRTPDGKPDLSGLWTKISPKYSRNIAADLKPEEIQPWARALVEQRREDLGKEYMNVKCVPLGPGYATAADSTGAEMMKIVQTPGLIVILNPDLTYRQIFLDGRTLESAPNPTWMGYSVGHWEGETLVVESFGFNDRTWLDHDGHPHTEALRMTERYRRRECRPSRCRGDALGSGDVLETVDGRRPGRARRRHRDDRMGVQRRAERSRALGRQGFRRTKGEVKVAPDILSKYVGTYEEQQPLLESRPRGSCRSRVADGRLVANMDGRGDVPLIATSDAAFTGLYGLGVEFIKGGTGGLFVKHVSGNYRFARK